MRKLRLAIAGLGGAVVAAAAVGYLIFSDQLQPGPVPQSVLQAEAALAVPGVGGLLHLDVSHAVDVEDRILGQADDEALAGPMFGANALSAVLLDSDVNIREAADHLIAAAIPASNTDGEGFSTAAILLGRFSPATIEAELREHFTVEAATIAGQPVLLLTRIDPATCVAMAPRAVHLSSDRLIMAVPETMGPVLERLQSEAPAATDLTEWRAFRDGRLMSAAVLITAEDLANNISHPAAQMAAGAAGEQLSPIGPVFVGVTFKPMPSRLLLEARAASVEAGWPVEVEQKFLAWRDNLTDQWTANVPSLVRLAGHMDVAADGDYLNMRLALSEELLTDAAEVPGEAISLMFGNAGFSVDGATTDGENVAEQIIPDGEVAQFIERASSADLTPFDPQLDFSFADALAAGPFVLRIDEFSLVTADDGSEKIAIEFAALSGAIPNMSVESLHADGDRTRAGLTIASVRGHDESELLESELCGRERNGAAAALQPNTRSLFVDSEFSLVPVVGGNKTVRLVPGARVDDIAAVTGHFDLRLPTEVQTFRIDVPFKDQAIEMAGVRIKLQDTPASGSSTVSYELSGEIDRVLAVRALNESGQYLRGGGGQASGRLMGHGKSVSKTFQGNPAAVEFVVAVAEEAIEVPFELTDVTPHFSRWDSPGPYTVETATLGALDGFGDDVVGELFGGACADKLGSSDLGPYRVCVDSLDVQWGGLNGRVQVLAPDTAFLNGNLSALELRIDAVSGADFETEGVGLGQFLRLREVYDQDYLEDTPWLQADAPEELAEMSDPTINLVRGTLIARLPTALDAFTLPVTELGARAAHQNGLAVRLIGFENGGLRLTLSGPRDRIVQFVPRDSDGVALATNNVRVDASDDPQQWKVWLSVSGRPQALDIVFASDREERIYPFDLTLDRGSQ